MPGQPLIGSLREFQRSPLGFSLEIAQNYGDIARVTMLGEESIFVTDWDRAGHHPGDFDTTVEGVYRIIAIHEKRHVKEIRAALAEDILGRRPVAAGLA